MQIFLRLLAVCGTHPLIWDAIAQVPGDWFAASRCCVAALKQTCYAKSLGGKKEKKKKRGKKSRLQFSPLLLQWSSSRPQLRCKLRFRMNAVACFHCSLGAIYLSYPIYAMHSGLEHKYTSSYNYARFFFFSLFCLPSLTAAQIHQIQRKRLQFQWSSFSHPKPHWFLCWGFLTTPVDFSIGFHFILWFEGFKWELRDTSALSTAPLLGVNFSLNEKCMH